MSGNPTGHVFFEAGKALDWPDRLCLHADKALWSSARKFNRGLNLMLFPVSESPIYTCKLSSYESLHPENYYSQPQACL